MSYAVEKQNTAKTQEVFNVAVIVAVLTFFAHRRMPYKKMLILTGVMLAIVLVVMVGESVQAGWISTTVLNLPIAQWVGLWFAVFPNIEGISAQIFAGVFVVGSYFLAQYIKVWRPMKHGGTPAQRPESAPIASALAREPVLAHKGR